MRTHLTGATLRYFLERNDGGNQLRNPDDRESRHVDAAIIDHIDAVVCPSSLHTLGRKIEEREHAALPVQIIIVVRAGGVTKGISEEHPLLRHRRSDRAQLVLPPD